jgi:hypothetical protein
MSGRAITRFAAVPILAFAVGLSGFGQSPATPAEESGFTRYSQSEDIALFLSVLDAASSRLVVRVVGRSAEVESFPACDLWLCILTANGAARPEELDRTKPTLFVTASQHGNEQSAKEAALALVRDLAVGAAGPLLDRINVLVMPQANPYGNFFDVRENENELDLNRDHVKVESAEVRAIHRVFGAWRPEVTLDVHEKGDDYYRVSLGCVSNLNIDPRLQEFSRSRLMAAVAKSLAAADLTFHEYLVTEEMGVNTAAGAALRPEDTAGREEMTRYSTTDLNDGRNGLGIFQTLSFIQEGASRHDLATLRERTRWQYLGIRGLAEAVAADGPAVLALVRGRREALEAEAKTYAGGAFVHLRTRFARDPNEPTLSVRTFEETPTPVRGILKVDKKAGEPVLAGDLAPNPYPRRRRVVTQTTSNWFPDVVPVLSVPRPLGYLIPAARRDVVGNLLRLGIEVDVLVRDATLDIEAYRATEVVPAKYDYLAPERIEVEKKTVSLIAKRGDFYVGCAQPGVNLIPCLLEPQSEYGFIRYWKYKLVPEAGDFFAVYRLTRPQDLSVAPYCRWERP